MIILVFCLSNSYKVKAISDYSSSSILMDMDSKRVLYEKNSNDKLLTASIAKIMTCIVAIENCDLNKYCIVDNETINQVGSSIYLDEGDKIKLIDLLHGLMLRSGNDAAYLVSISVCDDLEEFVKLMNMTAKKLKMNNTVFENPSGLDDKSKNYSTAHDMALLMSYCMDNEIFREITSSKSYSCKTYNGKTMYFTNKHKLLRSNDYVTGGKTGYTVSAKRTLVTSFEKDEMRLVVVTFNCGNDWEFHESLFEYGLENYKKIKFIDDGIFDLGIINYDATLFLSEDVEYVCAKDEDAKCVVELLRNNDNKNVIGVAKVIVNGKVVKEVLIYRFY